MHGSLLLHSLSYVHTQRHKAAHGSHSGRSWSELYQAKPMIERQVRPFADSRVPLLPSTLIALDNSDEMWLSTSYDFNRTVEPLYPRPLKLLY